MTHRSITADWIAVDWGTTHLRAWAMQGATPLAEATSDAGMAKLAHDQFERALLTLVEPWLAPKRTSVIACGMVGAQHGWVEAPYQMVPAKPLGARAVRVSPDDGRIAVYIIPGLSQATPPDVMRGEETQIAGFLALNPGWDGVICLPGTHTKWAQISAGEVVSFQTFMTGEMFGLLGQHSVLRHSVAPDGWDDAAFYDALDATLSRPETLAARLFRLRADDLLLDQPGDLARARLSGLLIGAELAAARAYWLGQQLALVGATKTAQPYASALRRQGVPVTIADVSRMTLAGLTAAYRATKETQ